MMELTIEATTENWPQVLAFVEENLEEHGCPMKVQTQIEIAAEEIFVNIAHYAYAGTPDTGLATVRIAFNGNEAELTFIDSGVPYNPLAKPDPDITLPSSKRPVGGLGIYMVKKSMDSVFYEYRDGKNIFMMRKAF